MRRPSPALVVACAALAIALSGVGYAATKLPRNSVGTTQLKNNAVNSAKVKDKSLKAKDFAPGQLPKGYGVTKIDITVANGNMSDVALPNGYTLRVECSGAVNQRMLLLGIPTGSGNLELTGMRTQNDASGDLAEPLTLGVGIPNGSFTGVGFASPDAVDTTGQFFRLGGTMVLHNATTVTTVVFDAFLDNRGNVGSCAFRGTAIPAG